MGYFSKLFRGRVGTKAQTFMGYGKTINSQAIKSLFEDSNGDVLMATGTVTVTNTGSGYAKGCIYIKTNAGSGVEGFFRNVGTNTSCIFEALDAISAGEIALAEGSLLIGNASGDAAALDASTDAQVVIGNGTTATSVAVSGDATIDNAGVLTIAANAVTETEILDDAVTNVKMGVPKLSTIQQTFAFGDMTDNLDATGQIDLTDTLPEGSIVVRAMVDEITGFTGDTTAVATIGDGTDVDRYNTGTVDVFTTSDHEDAGAPSGTVYQNAEETVRVTVTGGADFTSIAAGQMTVTLFYYQSV